MTDFKRIEAIDGLRGLSILLVILCHFDIAGFQGGFVGVDVFFVISGFVIMGSLAERLADPGLVPGFYERRARRLLPSLLVTLLVTLCAFALIDEKSDLLELAKATGWAAIGFSNFHFSQAGGYFDDTLLENPQLHTWSLAVEEQFYLLFSLLLLAVRAFGKRDSARIRTILFYAIALGSIVSLALAISFGHANSRASYFLLPTRFWEIGFGSLLLLVSRWVRVPAIPLLSLAGLALILVAATVFDNTTSYPSYRALLPTLGSLLIIAGTSQPEAWFNRILGSSVMTFLGRISYALYLVHWPALVFAEDYHVRQLTPLEKGGVLVFSLGAASLLTFALERPIQKRKVLGTRRAIWAVGAMGILTALIGAALAYATPAPAVAQLEFPIDGISQADVAAMTPSTKAGAPPYVESSRIPLIGPDPNNVTAIWGDSHALSLLQDLASQNKTSPLTYQLFVTWSSMPVLALGSTPDITRHEDEVCHLLVTDPRIKNIVLIANWTGYLEGPKYFGHRLGTQPLFSYHGVPVSRSDAYTIFETQLRQTLVELTSTGKSVFICTPTPSYPFDAWKGVKQLQQQGRDSNAELSCSLDDYQAANGKLLAIFASLAKELPHIYVIPIHEGLFADGRSILEKDGQPLYSDGHHLTPLGSDLIGSRIVDAIRAHGKGD